MKAIPASCYAAAMLFSATAAAAGALPLGPNVVAGAATVITTANAVTVNQGSARAIINWNSFSVGAGNSVQFVQPSAGSAVLNRVISADPSSILGQITSNGQVFLINPNGIVVGAGASINAGSIYLSTGNISNADFLANTVRFDPPPAGVPIAVSGTLNAGDTIGIHADIFTASGVLNAPSINLSAPGNAAAPVSIAPIPIALLPPPPMVAAGSATITGGGTLTLQGGNSSIINWDSFRIGSGNAAQFVQPSGSIAVLNTAIAPLPVIGGQLVSNGQVFLVNPGGITIAAPGGITVAAGVPMPSAPGAVAPASAPPPNAGMITVTSARIPAPRAPLTPTSPATSNAGTMTTAPAPLGSGRPLAPILPPSTAGLADGVVTVRISLVDPSPIVLR